MKQQLIELITAYVLSQQENHIEKDLIEKTEEFFVDSLMDNSEYIRQQAMISIFKLDNIFLAIS